MKKSRRPPGADLFRPASALTLDPRLTVALQGADYSGKTRWCLSAPGPIGIVSLDQGTEDTVYEYQRTRAGKKKQIHVARVKYTLDARDRAAAAKGNRNAEEDVKDQAADAWAKVEEAVGYLYSSGEFRTGVLDNFSEFYDLCRLYHHGKLSQVPPIMYVPVNATMAALAEGVVNNEKMNALFIHHEDAEYKEVKGDSGKKKSVKTSEFRRAGWKRIANRVQVQVRVGSEKDKETKEISRFLEVVKCRATPKLDGERFDVPPADFAFLAGMVFPELPEETWE